VSGENIAVQTRIMLVEDQADFRDLLAVLLGREPNLEVVAQAGSLAEARRHAATLRFDVVVLDLGLPDGNGADLIVELRNAVPGAAVLILSASLDPANLEKAQRAGADQILDKFASPEEIVDTIKRLGGG
jgi:DNA-binding NarL/FixJ family response regulator